MPLITRRAALLSGATLAAGVFGRKQSQAATDLKSLAAIDPAASPAELPPIRLVAPDGSAHAIADFAGQGIILNLWATWCIPCVAEMPSLARLAARLHDENIAVLPLSSDRGGAAAVEKFYTAHEITGLPVWLDPDGDAAHALKLRGVPTTLLIDRAGRERGRVEGAVDWTAAANVEKISVLLK